MNLFINHTNERDNGSVHLNSIIKKKLLDTLVFYIEENLLFSTKSLKNVRHSIEKPSLKRISETVFL